jgi:hypothetical protein
MTRFGTFRSSYDISVAAIARLKDWGPAYVDAINTAYGTGLKPLRDAIQVQELERYPENKLPCAVIVIAGTAGEPMKDADGYYSAIYNMIIGAVVAARSSEDTRRTAELYGTAVKMAVGQRRKLADDVTVQSWTGESIDTMRIKEQKRLLVCTNSFTVRLDNVFSWKEGPGPNAVPPAPADPVLADWPEASLPSLTIQREPV